MFHNFHTINFPAVFAEQGSTWKACACLKTGIRKNDLFFYKKHNVYLALHSLWELHLFVWFGFQRRQRIEKNLWNICEFCTLYKYRVKKNNSMDVLYWAWSVDMSVFLYFGLYFLFFFSFSFLGGGVGFWGNQGGTFSTCNDICHKGLRTEKA